MHTQSGAASFAACLQLFRCHPLAVAPPDRDGGWRSMVLRHRTAGFFVLTEHADAFVLRSWHGRPRGLPSPEGHSEEGHPPGEQAGIEEEIRPREPVTKIVFGMIAGGFPVPRHGALLGWTMGKQVTALLKVHSAPPATRDDVVPVPEIRVLPACGTSPHSYWPPFTCSPLDEFRLWEYVEWGEIVDVMPLVRGPGREHGRDGAGRVFWVPGGVGLRTGHIVVTDNLRDTTFWVPEGVYTDHWVLREEIEPPPAADLLAMPGVIDLAHGGW